VIVHFEINVWCVLSYLKGIQVVGLFVSTVFLILIFLGQTVFICQSYNAGLWSPPQRACTEKSKLLTSCHEAKTICYFNLLFTYYHCKAALEQSPLLKRYINEDLLKKRCYISMRQTWLNKG